MAYPPPWEHGLAARNLASIWRNYRDLGYRRLIYTNTNSDLIERNAIKRLVFDRRYDREVPRVRVASTVGASRWRSLLAAILPDRGLASCDTR